MLAGGALLIVGAFIYYLGRSACDLVIFLAIFILIRCWYMRDSSGCIIGALDFTHGYLNLMVNGLR